MHISATSSIPPVSPIDRHATNAPTHDPATNAATQPKVFTPAPPLRPNVQDYVDIDRTLIALRKL